MWLALASLLGVLASGLALVARWAVVRGIGPGYMGRFLLVQGGAINAALLSVCAWTSVQFGLLDRLGAGTLVCAYGALFFVYSLSNIDWTIKKFHDASR
jgi:hypothetical protein